ncbi:MAG TPA: S24 family peptidase [Sphingomicrobium sp.]
MAEAEPDNPVYAALMAVRPAGLSNNEWATRAGIHRSIFNGIRAHGNPTDRTIDRLLDAIGVSRAAFEERRTPVRTEVRGTGMSPQEARAAWSMPQAKAVPLLGTAFGGDWEELEGVELTELNLSEVLDNLARPPSLANDEEAYAIEIVGDSMAPRFEPGEHAFVSPKAAVRPGDDVVVQLTDPDAEGDLERRVTMVLIKRLVKRSASFLELKQFNPDRTFRVPIARVRRIHRVKGRL